MSSMAWMISRLIVLPRRFHEWVPRIVEPLRTVVTYCVWATALRYANTVLKSVCPHVLLAFNAPSAARLAGAWRHLCHVAPWKINARPDGDHDGRIARGYLFVLVAHSP
jgi:hypothetical protein